MIKEQTLKDRLEALMAERDTNARKLAIDAGLNETAIRDILKDRSKNPRHDTVQKIAAALNVTVGALLGLEPVAAPHDTAQDLSKFEQSAFQKLPNYVARVHQPIDEIPVYGYAAGSGRMTAQIEDSHIIEYRSRPDCLRGVKDGFYLSVIGDSMYPRFKPGELVAVHPGKLPKPGDDCLFIDDNGDAHIKEFVGFSDGGIKVKQWNPAGTATLAANEFSRLCTIVGMSR